MTSQESASQESAEEKNEALQPPNSSKTKDAAGRESAASHHDAASEISASRKPLMEDTADAPVRSAVMRFDDKQYVVYPGKDIELPAPKGFAESAIKVTEVMMVTVGTPENNGVVIGNPLIEGASVALHRIGEIKVRRELNFKRRRRKGSSKRTKGVRIHSMVCHVEEITLPAGI
ncbi:MAG: bL21 family ribosomal protein [Rhodobacteraceae bacterium]|nr:bL21 family ribosomal protein [Paracoccaceae bacterium]MCY4197369.1 bL21 family ribosomal protein [Paracoccaceae bacterium]MCY4326224.1 bL21 family ribosomal protein [Paracoccaceae bacterium]